MRRFRHRTDKRGIVDYGIRHVGLAGVHERSAVFRRLEPDDVVAEHSFADRSSHLQRKQAPVIRIGPRNMHELLQAGVRLPFAHHPRAEIEVIVLQHDQRIAARCLSGGDNLIREQLVDDDVAVPPGVPDFLRDVRRSRRIPQIVLKEPEQWVADDVVILVVRLRLGHDEAQAELARVAKLDQPFAGVLSVSGAQTIALGHRCRDPDRLSLAGDRADRRDNAAAPLARVERTVRLPRERYRASVRGDDEWTRAKVSVHGRSGRHEPLCLVRGRAIWHRSSFRARSRVRGWSGCARTICHAHYAFSVPGALNVQRLASLGCAPQIEADCSFIGTIWHRSRNGGRRWGVVESERREPAARICPWCDSADVRFVQRGYAGPTDEVDQYLICDACHTPHL